MTFLHLVPNGNLVSAYWKHDDPCDLGQPDSYWDKQSKEYYVLYLAPHVVGQSPFLAVCEEGCIYLCDLSAYVSCI